MKLFVIWAGVQLAASVSFAQLLPVHDRDFACTPKAVADQMVQDFRIDVRSFGGLELCNPAVDTKKLLNDLLLIKEGRFRANPTNNPLIRNFVPQDRYYDWMKSQTRGVARGNDIPFATAYNRGGYFTMQDGWAILSTLGRVGTIIHEARHTAGYRHIRCASGPYAESSTPGCDQDYNYGGSHGVEIEYYSRVHLDGENFHPVYKTMARLMAMGRGNFVFNQPVLRTKEALLGIEEKENRPVLFFQGRPHVRDRVAFEGALKRTSAGASVFDGRRAASIELYGPAGLQESLEDVYSYFKLLGRSPGPLKDFEEIDRGVRRYMVGLTANDQIVSYNFPGGKWGRLTSVGFNVVKSVTTLPNGERGYYLIDGQGRIFPYDPKQEALGTPRPEAWSEDLISVAHDEGGRLVFLRSDRTLWFRDPSGAWNPYAPGTWKSIVTVPLYDAYEVAP